MKKMKILSWNVNGLRAVINHGFYDFFKNHDFDILCIQETKISQAEIGKNYNQIKGFTSYWNSADKKGYAGTAIFTRIKPNNVTYGIGIKEFDSEGRVITMEFDDFYLINAYFPNSQHGLKRLEYKLRFNDAFLNYINNLRNKKPIIFCGDLNVAHKEIDLKNPKSNEKNPGFTEEERKWFDKLLKNGYIDTFREFTKEGGHYTWWSYRFNARARNIGWRIDYFIISSELRPQLKNAFIMSNIMGSDHCPVGIEIE